MVHNGSNVKKTFLIENFYISLHHIRQISLVKRESVSIKRTINSRIIDW